MPTPEGKACTGLSHAVRRGDLFGCELLATGGLAVGDEVRRHVEVVEGRARSSALLYSRAVRTDREVAQDLPQVC